ncbi:MAG: oligosaccharide flippase family protein, partial [Deltaproteobacteria bacterium]|nr:oligosaccharide flippase family protein [Deltaproteobacteria bacterium]
MPASSPDQPGRYRILQKFAYLISARGVRGILEAVFLLYLARHSTTTFGEFTLALGLGSILLTLSEFGLNVPLVTLLARKDRQPGEALGQVALLKGLLLALAALGALVFLEMQGYSPPLRRLMLLLALAVALDALPKTFFVALQVQGRQDLQGKLSALAATLGFGYGLLALVLGAPPLAVAAYKLIESLINLVGGLWLALSQQQFRPVWPPVRRLWRTLRLGAVFGLIEVTAITYNKANIFFLQRYAGAEAVAQYGAAWGLVDGVSSQVSSLLLQAILYPLFVQLWEKDRDQMPRLAQNTARWLMAAALVAMFFLFLESDRLIPLLVGPLYPEAIWLQKVLVVTVAFAFLHNLAAFLMISMGLARQLLIFYLIGLGVNLLWCSLVIPLKPLLGSALAMVVTKGGVAALTVGFCQWRLGLLPKKPFLHLAA